jgi:hypothetical protein
VIEDRQVLLPFAHSHVEVEEEGALVAGIRPGTDVMIFKKFSPKNSAKILAFFTQTTVNYENFDHNIGF